MKVLVTGGAGYIGSHTIIEILNNRSWEVVSVDNYMNSTPETYDRIRSICRREFEIVEGNLADESFCERLFQQYSFDGVIHFAALKSVPESVEQPLRYISNNLNSLLNLIHMSQKYGVTHFIFSSSCSVYGNAKTLPVDENTPYGTPESPYAFTKQMGEEIINECTGSNPKINFISLRYFNPVGAHMSGLNGEIPLQTPNNLVPFITQTAAGIREELLIFGGDYSTPDGTCIRDYIHICDIAHAHVLALDYAIKKPNPGGHELINLGNGEGVSVLEVVKAFEKASNSKLNYKVVDRRPGDVEAIYSNSEKARKLLNWKPKYSLEDMMLSAWKWQLEMLQEKPNMSVE